MAKELQYNATLVDRIDLTKELAIFKARLDKPLTQRFLPGQYVTIGLNNETEPSLGSVRRPMSIASAPEEGEVLEFYIRYVNHPESDNPLTHLLWRLASGQRLHIRPKAVGHFTLRDTIGPADRRAKILVAAGTGLAPFVSMVRSRVLQDSHCELSDHIILHGVSYPNDLGYRAELERYREDNALGYFTSVSRPKEVPDWRGDRGRVEDYFLEDRLGVLEGEIGLKAGGLTSRAAVVYICGLQGTIGDSLQRLIPRGFVPDNRKLRRALKIDDAIPPSLFFEQYDATPVLNLKDHTLMSRLHHQLHERLGLGKSL